MRVNAARNAHRDERHIRRQLQGHGRRERRRLGEEVQVAVGVCPFQLARTSRATAAALEARRIRTSGWRLLESAYRRAKVSVTGSSMVIVTASSSCTTRAYSVVAVYGAELHSERYRGKGSRPCLQRPMAAQ
jgi:hypothetical protein